MKLQKQNIDGKFHMVANCNKIFHHGEIEDIEHIYAEADTITIDGKVFKYYGELDEYYVLKDYCHHTYLIYNDGTEPEEEYYNLDEEYSENMPCDNSGYCIGYSCSNYAKCKGE